MLQTLHAMQNFVQQEFAIFKDFPTGFSSKLKLFLKLSKKKKHCITCSESRKG